MTKTRFAWNLETMINEPHASWDRKLHRAEIATLVNLTQAQVLSLPKKASMFRKFYADELGGKPFVRHVELRRIFAQELGVPYHTRFGEPVQFSNVHFRQRIYTEASVGDWLARVRADPTFARYQRYIDFVRCGGNLVEAQNSNGNWVIDYRPCKEN